jgi:hypothetical protein
VAAKLLCRPDEARPIPGLLAEIRRLLKEAYGFEQETELSFEAVESTFAQWLLFSEFVFDLPGTVPDSVTHVPCAEPAFRGPIFDLCHDLRSSAEHRDT